MIIYELKTIDNKTYSIHSDIEDVHKALISYENRGGFLPLTINELSFTGENVSCVIDYYIIAQGEFSGAVDKTSTVNTLREAFHIVEENNNVCYTVYDSVGKLIYQSSAGV